MLSRLHRDQRGVAMLTVLLTTFVTLTMVTVAVSSAVSSRDLSRRDQDWNAALASAEAGVDDYIYRLNRDGGYWQYSAALDPPDGNLAFKQWVPVPGPANEGEFRYDVDTSRLTTEGVIGLASTGRVRNTARTVEVDLRRRNFLDYLYFTDYETKDPAIYSTFEGDSYTPAQAQVRCALHYYAGRDVAGEVDFGGDTDGPTCTDITFFTRDTINGPLHSNDAILISGNPRFLGPTSTSWNTAGRRWRGSGSPFFANAGDPRFAEPLTIPPSNTAIRAETDPVVGGTGCLYTGPTRIVLNSNGTMNVTSPYTQQSNCLTGAGVQLPPNGVIYVQNVPADPGDPNYTAGCPFGPRPLGYPITNDITTYGCRDGDVFLEGTLNGRLTIAAEHSIIITWHTQYAGGVGGDDLLGLVANNYVEVYHPVRCTAVSGGRCTAGDNLQARPGLFFSNPVIHAAILSVLHSFRVQNYRWGNPLGQLRVTGAIAQRYRGIVGTFSGNNAVSGYEKAYVYDQRLRYQSPPHFLDPVKSAWQGVTWAERPPAYEP